MKADHPPLRVEATGNPKHLMYGGNEWSVPVYDHRGGSVFPTPSDRMQFYVLRLISIALNSINLLLTFRLGRFGATDTRLPLFALLLMTTLPQFLFVSATINNDNLADLLATLTILLSFMVLEEPARIQRYVALGLALGFGLLAKKTLFFLFPVVGVMLAFVWIRGRRSTPRIPVVYVLIVPALRFWSAAGCSYGIGSSTVNCPARRWNGPHSRSW